MSSDGNHQQKATNLSPRRQYRKAFKKFQNDRRRDPLLKLTPQPDSKFCRCRCGQHKAQSARYCIDCTDELRILRARYRQVLCVHATDRARQAAVRVYALFPPYKNVQIKNKPIGWKGDEELDRIIKLYEEERISY